MNLIVKYIKPIWPSMLLLIGITFLATFVTTLRPLVAAGIINLTLTEVGFSDAPEDVNSEQNFFDLNQVGSIISDFFFSNLDFSGGVIDAIPYFVTLLLLLSIVAGIIKYFGHSLNAFARSKVMMSMRLDLTSSLLALSLSFFNSKKSGELISRIITDAQAVAQGAVSVTHRILSSFLLIVVYFIFLINTSQTLTLVIFIIVIAHYAITTLLKNPVKKYEIENLEAMASMTASLQEVFSSIRLIQSYLSSNYSTRNLRKKIKGSSKAYFKTQLVGALEPESRYVLDGLAEGIILFVAITQLFSGAISIEGFLLYIYVARLLLGPINEFSSYFLWLQKIFASSKRINEYFCIESDIKDGKENILDFSSNIEFKDLNFAYEDKAILKDFSLTVEKNEVIAVVGKSGAGKSTLIDLMLRFYDPLKGSIAIDGKDIRGLSLNSYRSLFGVVLQEVSLLNDTIENNIRFGRDADDLEVIEASRIANADEFIRSLPEGYQTKIGDRGVKLSGGQRQRLSIARAIVGRPEILVLDEATSSLDSASEKKVQEGIENALKDRTAFVVAHRFSTIRNSSKIIVLNEGKIEAIGNHENLLKVSETYKYLSELQT